LREHLFAFSVKAFPLAGDEVAERIGHQKASPWS
jgi:hypothetical protein